MTGKGKDISGGKRLPVLFVGNDHHKISAYVRMLPNFALPVFLPLCREEISKSEDMRRVSAIYIIFRKGERVAWKNLEELCGCAAENNIHLAVSGSRAQLAGVRKIYSGYGSEVIKSVTAKTLSDDLVSLRKRELCSRMPDHSKNDGASKNEKLYLLAVCENVYGCAVCENMIGDESQYHGASVVMRYSCTDADAVKAMCENSVPDAILFFAGEYGTAEEIALKLYREDKYRNIPFYMIYPFGAENKISSDLSPAAVLTQSDGRLLSEHIRKLVKDRAKTEIIREEEMTAI